MYCHICYLEKDGSYECGVCHNEICLECCSKVICQNGRCPFCRGPIDVYYRHREIMTALYRHTKDICLTIALMITLFPESYGW